MLEEVMRDEVPMSTIDYMLHPYAVDCRYIKNASIGLKPGASLRDREIVLNARLSVPYCYYALDKGPAHFNATDFNLCFNQLFYVFVAESVRRDYVPELGMTTLEEVKDAQMERILIREMIIEMDFGKLLLPDLFVGELSVNKAIASKGRVFYYMDIAFDNIQGGAKQTGKATLTILPKAA